MTTIDASIVEKISPSQFMRNLRPEYYSDTEDRVAYLLDATTLEYHLDSITQRNQTHGFEIFCRKLCERTICPNLRAHTGPDGGGDSKADTETYPVAEEIAALFYVGEEKSARERWAFAFSAKKTWSTKVRNDVKGIVATGRDYKRIIFVTSRFARDKDRARIEDELSKQYGIPVTIHDRSWIVKEIIENDRKDIAYNYLKIGEAKNDPLRLGPKDYSREQQLSEIEKSIEDPEAFKGIEQQRVTEALIAAKLSRNMERPRTETDGRFLRAIRLADADGTYRQKLEAKYEHIWTAFWWFDDFQFLKDSYESFEPLVLKSDYAINLEFLCNLLQLFVNLVIHGHMSRDECKLNERTSRLKETLEQISADKERPNNALEAQTSLLIIRMNQVMLDKTYDELANVWNDFSAVLEKASGLGEFKADRLVQMVEIAGQIAGNDPAYNDLIEKTAEFVSNRKSEAEGALILLKRAQKLDFDDNFDIIRLLGKAAIGLTKKEYADGSLPESESDEDVNRIFSRLASQPVAQNLRGSFVLNLESPQTLSTSILGMSVEINIEGSIQSILVAEAVLGSLEAFFATAIEQRVVPHTEKLLLNLVGDAKTSKPSFEMDTMDMAGTIVWPSDLSPTSFEKQGEIRRFLAEVSGHVLAACCIIEGAKAFLEKFYTDEAVQHRMTMVAIASNSYHRVASKSVTRITDWQDIVQKSYELRSVRPTITLITLKEEGALETSNTEDQSDKPPKPKDHRAYSVRSVIDIHAWDQASWRGAAYAQFSPLEPPCVAFLFENEEGGRKIFERWRERFGTQDEHEEIYLSIIRQLPKQNKHHYCVLITSKLPETDSFEPNKVIAMASRSLVMEPDSDINLERFLESYRRFGAFYILPAVLGVSGTPEFVFDLSILKRDLTIKIAANVGEHDLEAMALHRFNKT